MKIKIMKRKRADDCGDQVQENGMTMMKNTDGHGVAWTRGAMLGEGGFGSVHLAIPSKKLRSLDSGIPSVMAVKSAQLSVSQSIQQEKQVLSELGNCPNIIRCFGEEITVGENDRMVYNLLLEYASGGSLADKIYQSGDQGLPESEVRCYTRSILEGLNFIHEVGYVHRDLKPDNVLLVPKSGRGTNVEFTAKLCDFGMAKRVQLQRREAGKLEPYWMGTPMYLAPEAARDGVQDTKGDIWSLGCTVLEMLTGNPTWNVKDAPNFEAKILKKLQKGNKLPKIPRYLSRDARNFLKCCLERSVSHRLSAKILLTHPFVDALEDEDCYEFEEEEIEHMDDCSSICPLIEERSCCFRTPSHYGPQYRQLIA